jgi:mannosyltransferase
VESATVAPRRDTPSVTRIDASSARRLITRTELWCLVAIVAAGAALRFATLDLQSFWDDEAVTVGGVLAPSLWTTLGHIPSSEASPPLYYVIAWAWTRVFGHGEVGVRSLSALLGTVTIPVAWWAGRRLIAGWVGLAAAALVAFSPEMVWYSQEARGYALLVLLCAASLGFMGEALRTRERRMLGWWALASGLAIATHYFGAFVAIPEAAALVWLLPEHRRAAIAWTAGVGAVGAALLPLAIHQAGYGHDVWIKYLSLPHRLRMLWKEFTIGRAGTPPDDLLRVAHVAVIAAAAVAGWGGLRRVRGPGFALAAGVGLVALGLPLALKLVGEDYFYSRNLIGAWIPLAAAVGAAATVRWIGPAVLAAVCAVFLALNIVIDTEPRLQRADWRGVSRAIGPAPRLRVIVAPKEGRHALTYYLARAREVPEGPVVVAEIDLLGRSRAPGPRFGSMPTGFHLISRLHRARFYFLRYVSSRPERVTADQLRNARLDEPRAAVLLQRPG